MSQAAEDGEAWVEDDGPTYETDEASGGQQHHSQSYFALYLNWLIDSVLDYFSNPWVILLSCIGVYIVYQRQIKPRIFNVGETYQAWQERRQQDAEVAAQKKNPDLYRERMEGMERARQRQQEQFAAAAREYAEKQKEKEEQKRAEKLEQLENLRSGKGYNNKSEAKSNKLRSDDYNPLMGGGGSGGSDACYRPARRAPSSGGGG